MRILIHALAASEIGGSDRHLRGMLSALEEFSPHVNFLVYINDSFRIPNTPRNVVIRSVPVHGTWYRLFWDQLVLPKIIRKERVGVIWATLGFGSLRPPVPQIYFQRNAVYYNDFYLNNLTPSALFIIKLRRWLLLQSMQASSFIITPTLAMRDMILTVHPNITADKFKIIPHAFNPNGMTSPLHHDVVEKLGDCAAETVKILYVGYILPEKGLFNLLDAIAAVKASVSEPFKLFLTISRDDWAEGYDLFVQKIADMGLHNHVTIIGKIPGDCMGEVYQVCDVLIYPSVCESFGFPLYEALSKGMAIVAVDTAVNREGAGECAIYYPPGDKEAIVSAFIKVITEPILRKSIGAAGRIRFEKNHLHWIDYCRQCLDLSKNAADALGRK